jgi:hypothetical protein
LLWSELVSRLKERFGASVRSKLFRFLHLLRKGTSVPMTTTSTANPIKNQKDPALEVAVAGVATGAGVLTGSEDVLVAAGVGLAAAGVLSGSVDVLAVTAGVVEAAAGVAGSFRGRAGSRTG